MSPTRQQIEEWRTAFAASADAVRDGEECPSTELLWRSAEGKLSGREAEQMILHLGECGSCSAAWRLARELAPPVVTAEHPATAPGFAFWRWAPAAAALVSLTLVAALGILQLPDWPGHESSYRATQDEWLRPTFEADRPLDRDRAVLTWAAGPPGTTYELRVTTESLDVVFAMRHLDRPVATVPAGALETIPDRGKVLWQVTAHLPDGTEVDSKTFITPLD